ncbi:hypothetical protein V3C99_016294 [Haemonchus contortus]
MAEQTEFQKRLMQIGIHGTISAIIALGYELHLFVALAKVGSEEKPATPKQVADESECKERYVKEWLSVMATGEIIEVNEEEKFWIPKERVADLTSGVNLQMNLFLPLHLKSFDSLCAVFKKDGPLGLKYSDFTGFYKVMSEFSESLHKKHLVSDFIPALGSDLPARLKEGGLTCLDVGCGNGFHAAFLAQNFPNSKFTGIDVISEAVDQANQRRKDDGQAFDNLTFIQMDAGKMDLNWSNKFDMVTIFDACHDQMRPDLCLKEIHRVLKPGGVFGMLEIKGSSNVYTDRKEIGLFSAQLYGASVFHCLPVGSNSPDALGLGTMWGKERAVKLLKEAGFNNISVVPTPQFAINVLYVCKKE